MADAQILEATGANVLATDTTWVDVAEIAAASFTANAKYLILAFAQATHASSANDTHLRLVRGETPTLFTDAEDIEEMLTTSHVVAQWLTVFTQPGTTERIRIQARSSSTTDVTAEWGHILAINLDDIGTEDTDYRYTEVTTDLGPLTTSYQDGASETWTPNGTDKYLYLGHLSINIGDTSTEQTDVALDVDGTIRALVSEEGEDAATEIRNRLLVWAETPSNASHTVKVKAKNELATNPSTILSSRVFILNLSKFAQAGVTNGTGTTALTEGAGWINLATLAVTPSATGDFVLLGSMILDYNAATGTSPIGRLQVNPDGGGLVSRPNYGDDGPGVDTWDGTDQRVLVLFDLVSLTSGASRTINLDGQMSNTGVADPQVFDRALVYFSKALASSGTNASAGHAAGTGAANNAGKTLAPNAGTSAGTGAAQNAPANVQPNAGNAAGTGAAQNATKSLGPTAQVASGTGAANQPGPSVFVNAGHAAGTGASFQPTVSTAAATEAPAGHAAGTGTASNATTSIATSAGNAAGTGSASNATPSVAVNAGHAAGTGAAHNPTIPVPIWTTPADAVTIGASPELKFTMPDYGGPLFFQMQLDTAATFNTGDLRIIDSFDDQTGWDYWNGSAWTAVPGTGVPSTYAGNEARYTVQTPLTGSTTWYRRVRAGI